MIALHGWLGDRTSFDTVLPFVDGRRFTYALPDARGYGEAMSLGGRFSTVELANDVLLLADRLGWASFSVVGHAMGGHVAQYLAAMAPARVRKLIGISPIPASGAVFDVPSRRLFTKAVDAPAARRALLDRSTGGVLPATWLDQSTERSITRSRRTAVAGYLPYWTGTGFHRALIGNTTPALAITGRLNTLLSPETLAGTWMRWFANSELVILEGAGGYAMDETPLATAAIIERFLEPGL
ncbi:alpha/beta fold hydrolase [Amycolatopsis japonica]